MKRIVTVAPEDGLHARPATAFVRTANGFDADVRVGPANGDLVEAESVLAVTSLGVPSGQAVRIVAEGADAEAALDALESVLSTPEAKRST